MFFFNVLIMISSFQSSTLVSVLVFEQLFVLWKMELRWLLNPQEKALFACLYMYYPHMAEHRAPWDGWRLICEE